MSTIVNVIDPSLYSPTITQDAIDFFKQVIASTGTSTAKACCDNDEKIKQHILAVQEKVIALSNYECICRLWYTRPKIASLPGYQRALELLENRGDTGRTEPILLDIGCCVGNDVRKAVLDGWPAKTVVASDLRGEFWEIGHELFMSTPESFPATFVQGNIFHNAFLCDVDCHDTPSLPSPSNVNVNTITTLTPLTNRVSAIHASYFFHLFHKDEQLQLARRLASLLVHEPGSIIFGQHAARPVQGYRVEGPRLFAEEDGKASLKPEELYMYCHSPESWREMWVEDVFGHDRPVKVEAELIEVERNNYKSAIRDADAKFWVMNWSVSF